LLGFRVIRSGCLKAGKLESWKAQSNAITKTPQLNGAAPAAIQRGRRKWESTKKISHTRSLRSLEAQRARRDAPAQNLHRKLKHQDRASHSTALMALSKIERARFCCFPFLSPVLSHYACFTGFLSGKQGVHQWYPCSPW
jgi:hypothetical protein